MKIKIEYSYDEDEVTDFKMELVGLTDDDVQRFSTLANLLPLLGAFQASKIDVRLDPPPKEEPPA